VFTSLNSYFTPRWIEKSLAEEKADGATNYFPRYCGNCKILINGEEFKVSAKTPIYGCPHCTPFGPGSCGFVLCAKWYGILNANANDKNPRAATRRGRKLACPGE